MQQRLQDKKFACIFLVVGGNPDLAGILPGNAALHRDDAKPSSVAFDFAVDPDLLSPRLRVAVYVLSTRVVAAGEPVLPSLELTKELKNLGFRHTQILQAEEINAR